MSILKILQYPDKKLRKIAKPVITIDDTIYKIVNDMFETMYFYNGIGLAATQVDIHKQIIVIDISENKSEKLLLINPILMITSGSITMNEGCLSIPNKNNFVTRARKIKLKALKLNGQYFILEATNLLAVCIQHEMDHLIGKLFIDNVSE